MSIVVKLMIAGWTGTFAMIGFFALKESGKLLRIRQRVASWLQSSDPSVVHTADVGLPSEDEAA
jgi:hypothetical protein